MKKKMEGKHTGSSFDSFLEERGILEEVEAVALKRVLAWQLQNAMAKRRLSKQQMAQQLKTSRSQVDRLLNPSNTGVSIATISKAAHAVGKRIRLELVDERKPVRRTASPKTVRPRGRKRA